MGHCPVTSMNCFLEFNFSRLTHCYLWENETYQASPSLPEALSSPRHWTQVNGNYFHLSPQLLPYKEPRGTGMGGWFILFSVLPSACPHCQEGGSPAAVQQEVRFCTKTFRSRDLPQGLGLPEIGCKKNGDTGCGRAERKRSAFFEFSDQLFWMQGKLQIGNERMRTAWHSRRGSQEKDMEPSCLREVAPCAQRSGSMGCCFLSNAPMG